MANSTGASEGLPSPTWATTRPPSLALLLANVVEDPRRDLRVHAELRDLLYPVLQGMKVESHDFFTKYVATAPDVTLSQSFYAVSGMTRVVTIEWLLSMVASSLQKFGFDRPLVWKALGYLDGFYSSSARAGARSKSLAKERAFAACIIAWKMTSNTRPDIRSAIKVIGEELMVSLDLSEVLRMEMELVSELDFKISSPSITDFAEAIVFYFSLLGAWPCANLTMRIAHVLVTDDDIAGNVEPASVALVSTLIALRFCATSAATYAGVEQEIRRMFNLPGDPLNVHLLDACVRKLYSLRSSSLDNDDGKEGVTVSAEAPSQEAAAAASAAEFPLSSLSLPATSSSDLPRLRRLRRDGMILV
eukprot:TRINITY_DN44381_c0_g2_i2.p1 TRINITY_DN44381_c0_g2~~TRINITY_DN44381_c0_g2_i2.p1  ORF type:complete len:361 (-),score=61.63 TRINITY_DN44381_c0_g2_i2:494-1576(-)